MALAVVLFAIVGFVLTDTRLDDRFAFGGIRTPRWGLPTVRVILFAIV